MTEFKKSSKGGIVNERAMNRQMPDPQILYKVREEGVNQAMKNYVPPKGTTLVRTKEDAHKVIKVLR